MNDTAPPDRNFRQRVFVAAVIVIATAAAAWLLGKLASLLLLVFACVLTALILVTIGNLIRRRIPMSHGAALAVTVLIVAAVLGGAFWFFGRTMSAQFAELIGRLPTAWDALQSRLQGSAIGANLLGRLRGMTPTGASVVAWTTEALRLTTEILSGLIVVIVGGLYLAAQPGLYIGGALRLIPEAARPQGQATLDAIAASLRGWLKGQALGMLFVGLGTGIGLAIAGVPAAAAIGIVAGIGEFVPYLGTIVAGIPAVLLGFSVGADVGLWALAVLLGVQQIQGHIIMPLLQRSMVDLPPALTVFGIIAAGLLFGPVGILLATPLTIVILVLVRRLYLRDETPLTGKR